MGLVHESGPLDYRQARGVDLRNSRRHHNYLCGAIILEGRALCYLIYVGSRVIVRWVCPRCLFRISEHTGGTERGETLRASYESRMSRPHNDYYLSLQK